MTVVEFLQDKYQQTHSENVTEWLNSVHSKASLQAATVILLRGKKMGALAMIGLGIDLGCTKEELVWIAKECGDHTIWRAFVDTVLNNEESRLINMYRTLKPAQKRLITEMAKELKP